MVYNRWSWKVLWILFVYGKGQFWKLNRLIAQYSEAQTGCPRDLQLLAPQLQEAASRPRLRRYEVDHVFRTASLTTYITGTKKVWYFRPVVRTALWLAPVPEC